MLVLGTDLVDFSVDNVVPLGDGVLCRCRHFVERVDQSKSQANKQSEGHVVSVKNIVTILEEIRCKISTCVS